MLVGRTSEQRALSALVSSARIGQSAVLVLTGEAGIGKTALLEHVAAQARGMRVLRATGTEAEQNLPFAGLAQLLRATAGDLNGLPPPQADALGVALALRVGGAVDRFAVAAATLTLLTQRSEDRPVAVLVDDAQLLDMPSQEVLAFVARRLLADAVALVATVRAGEPCRLLTPDLPQRSLGGLDREETAELVAQHLEGPRGSALTDQVYALSAGNPLAILELAGRPERLASLWPGAPGPVPAALVDLYARRVATLDPDARTALLLAAAAGNDLPLVARACAALLLPVSALAAAERLGLIALEQGGLRFIHPLVRAALYSTADPAERRRLHATLAAATSTADTDRYAWHLSEAALGPDEPAATALHALGDRASLRGAFAVATTAFGRAAGLSGDDQERAARLFRAGEAAWHAGDAATASGLLERSAALETQPAARVSAQRLRGIIDLRSGSVVEARDSLLAAAAASRADPAGAVACSAEAIYACFYLADADAALALAGELEDALAGGLEGRAAATASVAAGLGRVLAGAGGPELVRQGVRWLADAAPALDYHDQATWTLVGPLLLRESRTGRELVRSAIDERRGRTAVGTLPHLLFHLARDEATTDRWVSAEADYTEAITLARELGQTTELAMSSAGLAALLARQGRADAVLEHAAEAERLGVEHQVHLARLWSRYGLGDLAYGRGEIEAAVRTYAGLEALLEELGVRDVDLSPAPDRIEALLSAGRTAEAVALAGPHQERAEAKGQAWALARAARVAALLGPAAEVDERFARALALHAETPDCYEAARTELAYGARLRRLRRRVDARPHLERALAEFSRLGASPWADRAADELTASGATAARAGASLTRRLTPRELQIALLLAEGRTVRETAAAVFLSPKTVEYHLRHVYTKLGIDSRDQLREAVRSGSG